MAYTMLKDEARTEDRLIRSFGVEAHVEAELEAELGFDFGDYDDSDEGVVEGEHLAAVLDYWNERLE